MASAMLAEKLLQNKKDLEADILAIVQTKIRMFAAAGKLPMLVKMMHMNLVNVYFLCLTITVAKTRNANITCKMHRFKEYKGGVVMDDPLCVQ
mmetsp:Transcript_14511/g.19071  ORF Transcript_14511/g.19071 Transcript_14511/m.19071 type:complete len:93 (-) Transcript_14511:202-480(-)